MPKSKSKRKSTARAASFAGLPKHPAMANPDCMLMCRMGSEDEMRLPDEHAQPTAATVLPDDYTLTANADGDLVHCILYNLNSVNQVVTAGTTAATSVAIPTTRYTSFTNAAHHARTVCVKVQIMYVGSEMSASGYVSVSSKTSIVDIQSQTMAALHNNCDKQFKAQDGLTAYVGYRQTPRFESPTASTFMNATFPVFVIAASGLPAGAVLKVRVLRFMEFQPKEGDLSEGSVMAEPYNPASMAVSSQLNTTVLSHYTGPEQPGFMARLKGAANAAYHIAQPMLPYVVSEARTMLQRYAAPALANLAPLMLTM